MLDLFGGAGAQDRFARSVMTRLKARDAAIQPRYDRDRFAVEWGHPPARLFLENTFAEWSAAPKTARDTLIEELVELAFVHEAATLSWTQAAPRLLPSVLSRLALLADPATNGGRDPQQAAAFHLICGDLVAQPSIAAGRGLSLITHQMIADWGVQHAQVMNQAMANLRAATPAPRFERAAAGFYVSAFEDYYDASRLLLPDLFRQLELEGPPIAVAVSRRGLVVAGSNDTAALQPMSDYIERVMETETRPISCAPVILNAGRWWPLNRGAPQAWVFDRLYAIQAILDRGYDEAARNG